MGTAKVEYTSTFAYMGSAEFSSLADTSAATGSTLSNISNKYFDSHVFCRFKGTANSSATVNVYALGSNDNALFTSESNAKLIGVVQMSSTLAVNGGPFSVANAFGGILPKYRQILVDNESNGALATGASSEVSYCDVYYSA